MKNKTIVCFRLRLRQNNTSSADRKPKLFDQMYESAVPGGTPGVRRGPPRHPGATPGVPPGVPQGEPRGTPPKIIIYYLLDNQFKLSLSFSEFTVSISPRRVPQRELESNSFKMKDSTLFYKIIRPGMVCRPRQAWIGTPHLRHAVAHTPAFRALT